MYVEKKKIENFEKIFNEIFSNLIFRFGQKNLIAPTLGPHFFCFSAFSGPNEKNI